MYILMTCKYFYLLLFYLILYIHLFTLELISYFLFLAIVFYHPTINKLIIIIIAAFAFQREHVCM